MKTKFGAAAVAIALLPACIGAQGKGKVVDEIVARVNNDIITLSDYQRAEAQLHQEVTQECQNCTPGQIEDKYNEQHKDLLRDLVDQSLLVQRAKDLDLSVESDVVKRLDEVRQQNNLTSMEELQKAVEAQGMGWEEYKSQIRNTLLTQEVVRREVSGHMTISDDDVKKYYDAHVSEFNRPEQVLLEEIRFSTENKTPDDIAAAKKKADDVLARLKKGEDFEEMAKRYSDGPTAKQGGQLGEFERGQLAKELEDTVFKMNKGEITDVIETKTAFEILKVFQHYTAGIQPIEKVQNEISNKLFMQQMQPAMRSYLSELREQSYVIVKPGFVDSGAATTGQAAIEEVAPTPDVPSSKKSKSKKHKSGV
ncbi:MAG: peptidylprolyl isomerase [Candidatus Acidiferrales bacterium]